MADASGVRAGGAFVEIFAKDAALQKGLRKAEKDIESFGKAVLKVGAGLGAIGAGITAPLILATNQFAESGAALKDMSDRTGVSVETLSLLGYAAKQTGADIGAVEVGIRKMQKSLTAGSLENAQAQQTFANLGLSVQALTRLKPEEQFVVIGKRIAMIKDESARAGAAMMIFGRSGTELIPMAIHMEKLSKEAHEFGLITKTETAEAAKRLKDSMGLLEAVIGKITSKIGSALAPSFERWNIQAAKVGKQIMDLIDKNKPLIPMIFQVGLAFTAAGIAVAALGTAIVGTSAVIGGLATIVGAIHTGLLLMLSPIGLIIVGFVGMNTAMGKWGETGATVADFMKKNFSDMLKIAEDTIKGMSDALMAGDIQLAAKILFAGLNVEFLKGTTKISELWNDWGVSLVEAFRKVNFDIAAGLIELNRVAETIFAKIKAGAEKGGVGGAIKETAKIIMPATPGDIVARAAGIPDTQDLLEGVLKGKAPGLPEQPPEQNDINKRAMDAQNALRDAQKVEEENRRKAAADKLAAAKKEFADAEAELNNLNKKARIEAGEPEASGQGGQGPGKRDPLRPEHLDKALEKAKVDVKGSFSAQAITGLGAGESIQKEQLSEQKTTNKHLEKISHKQAVGKDVFGT